MSTAQKEHSKENNNKKEKVDLEKNLETDEDNNNTKSKRSQKESKDSNSTQQEEEKEEQITSEWMAVWDANAQAYYWWNTTTNETTWENPTGDSYDYSQSTTTSSNPLDTLLDKIDSQVKTTLDNGEVDNTPYENYFSTEDKSYTSQAHFNARTGRFTTNQDVERLNPSQFTIENRATKQMNYYFDVDSYTEEYNRQRQTSSGSSGKKRALSRKEVEYFKKMKKEKKSKRAREWLLQ